MSAHVTVRGLEELYREIVRHFGDEAPDAIVVVTSSGEAVVYDPLD